MRNLILVGLFVVFATASALPANNLEKMQWLLQEIKRDNTLRSQESGEIESEFNEHDIKDANQFVTYVANEFGGVDRAQLAVLMLIGYHTRCLDPHSPGCKMLPSGSAPNGAPTAGPTGGPSVRAAGGPSGGPPTTPPSQGGQSRQLLAKRLYDVLFN